MNVLVPKNLSIRNDGKRITLKLKSQEYDISRDTALALRDLINYVTTVKGRTEWINADPGVEREPILELWETHDDLP